MEFENQTSINAFILLGLSDNSDLQIILFLLFFIVYMATVAGNVLLILAVRVNSRLHVSMYFFLANLSFLDICYTSIILPKMLVNIAASSKCISFSGCFLQLYFYLLMGETECVLLAFMAYDRFVAICNPLRYNVIMNAMSCLGMISVSWVTGCIISSIDLYFTYQLQFCGPATINHFFCEGPSLLQLACSDISENNIVMLVGSTILLLVPLSLILYSYVHIFLVILKIQSGRYKAFSTCTSHLIVVIIFYGTGIFMYMQPRHRSSDVSGKIIAIFYTIITPMLNPLIYSLRNKDVHQALRQVGKSMVILQGLTSKQDAMNKVFPKK
ncbi:olfactory receptor 2D3-like [Hyla sarda]|uniref:olfactory receptor 2D3-like n=1 Tax=Hyla sarda TaxID=327740 RepID=UPI0024C45EA4|nr:olfactory receptor 2D3-like [Hyla sarda]